jgi:hypothetical protein
MCLAVFNPHPTLIIDDSDVFSTVNKDWPPIIS